MMKILGVDFDNKLETKVEPKAKNDKIMAVKNFKPQVTVKQNGAVTQFVTPMLPSPYLPKSVLDNLNRNCPEQKQQNLVWASGSMKKNSSYISFKGDFFENNYTKNVEGKEFQGLGLMERNEIGTPEWYDFNKVGSSKLLTEPLDWESATPEQYYVFLQANALAEGYETSWVRRFNYTNCKKPLATLHSICSRKAKEPPSKALRGDVYRDKSFATNIAYLLDTKHHKSLDKPVTEAQGRLCIDAVVFDTETTGTNIDDETKPLDKIIQIGAIQLKNGKIVPESALNQLINPEIHIPEGASAVHGLYDGDVADAPVMEKVLKPFVNDYLNKKNGIIVAYNSKFDITMLNNAIRDHNEFSADELKPKRYFKVLDPFLLMQRIHPYVGASKKLSKQYTYLFAKNMENAHDAFSDVKGTVDVLKYTLYYLSEHRKDKTRPLTLREVLLFQNGFVVPNIDIPLDSDGCNARVNMRASYRPVSLSVDNYHDGYMLTKEDIKELEPVIGEKNAAKLKYSVADEKFDLSSSNAGYPQNPPETQRKPDEAGMQDAFYVMKSNFQKVLGFCKLEDYGDKTKQEITDLITEKAKHYIHKDSIDFWMKNPNPLDIKEGNDLPDFEIARRVMTEE